MIANFGLILVCLLFGILLKRSRTLPETAPLALNSFVINLSLPAVALLNLHDVTFERRLLYPIGMAWILFAAGFAFFVSLGRARRWSPQAIGALVLTGGLANTSFVGFPLLVALYGPESLRTGILTDQPGSFLVLSSLGVLSASLFSSASAEGRAASLRAIPGRLLRFPPFVAMLAAFALHGWAYPAPLREILEKLSVTLVPAALVSVGLQMSLARSALSRQARPLAAGLLFKLVLGPAVILALYAGILGARGRDIEISIVQAAMAPMITGAILAASSGLDAELANLMITAGIPLSLVTVPLWSLGVRHLCGR